MTRNDVILTPPLPPSFFLVLRLKQCRHKIIDPLDLHLKVKTSFMDEPFRVVKDLIRDVYFEYTGGPRFMQSFYLRFRVYAIRKWPFSETYPLIYSHPWSIYMRIHYMQTYFWSPYLSHITRSNCSYIFASPDKFI